MNLSPALQNALTKRLSDLSLNAEKIVFFPVGGGSINQCYRVQSGDKQLFCKINSATKFPQLFALEQKGLELLGQQSIIRTPAIIDSFLEAGYQFLLLEWLREGQRTPSFWRRFGEQLAALHRVSADQFGLEVNNYMGSVPQQNGPHDSWCAFFTEERILPMVKKCTDKNLLNKSNLALFDTLLKQLPQRFNQEAPSLLHGDLWSGNFLCSATGEPVLIDPAVYYGHRSADRGLTTLFGGFEKTFYHAYHECFPLPANYKEQWELCNLYPLLIHLYLFGTSYLPQIENTLKQFN